MGTINNSFTSVEMWNPTRGADRGPFLVVQAGIAPGDELVRESLFILRPDGKWVDPMWSRGCWKPELLDEALFPQAVMELLGRLGPKARWSQPRSVTRELQAWIGRTSGPTPCSGFEIFWRATASAIRRHEPILCMNLKEMGRRPGSLRNHFASRVVTDSVSRRWIPATRSTWIRKTSHGPRRRWQTESRRWRSCRTAFMPRTVGRCCSSSKPWMPRARTAPSSTSCRASIRRVSGVLVQGADQRGVDHDHLWRSMKSLPERGRIGIFNRSYYEETLVVRVHPEMLQKQRLRRNESPKRIWDERFQDIRAFERYQPQWGGRANSSPRFEEGAETALSGAGGESEKNWKFSSADIYERGFWKEYQHAYEDMIRHTATPEAPWYVVPADNKWFT